MPRKKVIRLPSLRSDVSINSSNVASTVSKTPSKVSKGPMKRNFHSSVAISITSSRASVRRALAREPKSRTAGAGRDQGPGNMAKPGEGQRTHAPSNTLQRSFQMAVSSTKANLRLLVPSPFLLGSSMNWLRRRADEALDKLQPACNSCETASNTRPTSAATRPTSVGVRVSRHPGKSGASRRHYRNSSKVSRPSSFEEPKAPTSRCVSARLPAHLLFPEIPARAPHTPQGVTLFEGAIPKEQLQNSLVVDKHWKIDSFLNVHSPNIRYPPLAVLGENSGQRLARTRTKRAVALTESADLAYDILAPSWRKTAEAHYKIRKLQGTAHTRPIAMRLRERERVSEKTLRRCTW
mmetsp:Transcript_44926/g.65951  ORF Transcript_44926/g.65951 Transcript_44926/m.65951 type:complete len:351 (+) Transcript_44926:63-1115(+)